MTQAAAERFRFEFPEALRGGLWSEIGTTPMGVPDARAPIREFFDYGTAGWAFEAAVRGPDNLAVPHAFSYSNWSAAHHMAGVKIEWDDLAVLVGAEQAALRAIPVDADLWRDWPGIATPAAALLRTLTDAGLSLGAATCLAYQKRPCLFPHLNRGLRRALNLPAGSRGRADLGPASLERLRAVALHPPNHACLDRLEAWLGSQPYVTRMMRLSRVRLVNLIASGLPRPEQEEEEPLKE